MFLKGYKKKSAKKYIANKLLEKRAVNTNKIKTLGVLVDARIYDVFPFGKEIAGIFDIPAANIQILYFHPDKKIKETFQGNLLTSSDLSFRGNLKNEAANAFIENAFDGLLNFYDTDALLLNLVSVKSKATFKFGFATINENINDFSVATNMQNITEFTSELKKYLTILNKI